MRRFRTPPDAAIPADAFGDSSAHAKRVGRAGRVRRAGAVRRRGGWRAPESASHHRQTGSFRLVRTISATPFGRTRSSAPFDFVLLAVGTQRRDGRPRTPAGATYNQRLPRRRDRQLVDDRNVASWVFRRESHPPHEGGRGNDTCQDRNDPFPLHAIPRRTDGVERYKRESASRPAVLLTAQHQAARADFRAKSCCRRPWARSRPRWTASEP